MWRELCTIGVVGSGEQHQQRREGCRHVPEIQLPLAILFWILCKENRCKQKITRVYNTNKWICKVPSRPDTHTPAHTSVLAKRSMPIIVKRQRCSASRRITLRRQEWLLTVAWLYTGSGITPFGKNKLQKKIKMNLLSRNVSFQFTLLNMKMDDASVNCCRIPCNFWQSPPDALQGLFHQGRVL